MTDHVTDTLRRTMKAIADAAPDAPPLRHPVGGRGPRRRRQLAIALAAFASVLMIGAVSLLLVGGPSAIPEIGSSNDFEPETGRAPSSTTPTSAEESRIPLDGRPEELGVESFDFVTAVFPTSPVEHRVSAAWQALRHNVEGSWLEACMEEQGLVIEMPRVTAGYFNRNRDMPDFELDAELGIVRSYDAYAAQPEPPSPPTGASDQERANWEAWYAGCSSQVEAKRSTQFDQVIGRIEATWWDIVREVNASAEMEEVTTQLLTCVAEQGGPDVDNLWDLYSTRPTGGANSLEEAAQTWNELAVVIAACAGDYSQVRQNLLIPFRDQLVKENADVLSEAKPYFDEVIAASR